MAYETITIRGKEVKIDENLRGNFDNGIKLTDKKFDTVFIVDGMEGSGKSELARQAALYMDNDFTLNNLVFTDKQFYEAVENAKPGSVILWDEFVMAGLSTEALSKMQTALVKKFTTIRHKRLIIILVIPYIFMLRKYFALARARSLIHVYTSGLYRGFFKFYDYTSKNMLYNFGHKFWFYSDKVKPSFIGHFQNWSMDFLDEEAYEQKKIDASDPDKEDLEEENLGIHERRFRNALIETLKIMKECGVSREQAKERLKMHISQQTIHNLWER